ncbi:MAG: glycosyltransferase [Mucilaginibacter sp.]
MNKSAQTLIILSPGFPENEVDTTCVPPLQVFVKNLQKNFPHLNIIVLAFQYPFVASKYQWKGVNVISFGGQNKSKLSRVLNWARIWMTLRSLKKQNQLIGLLSFWMGDCAFIGGIFAKRNRLKHFCWLMGQDAKPGNKYFKWIKPRGEYLIALSDFIADEFYKNYSVTPAHVIPIGIDPALFAPLPAKRDIDILGAGYLIPLKQYDLFVNVINLLRKSHPGIRTVICGKGPELEPLRALIKSPNLERNVELLGELPHGSVLALMQRSKVFLHTSAYEGFGMVCLEALYAGARVVSMVQPMNARIENWHIVYRDVDLVHKLKELLGKKDIEYKPVSPYLIDDSARSIAKLFDYSDAATS